MRHTDEQQPYLALRNIDKFFGPTKALLGMQLDIYAGEVIGLVGPNGAGKSTLIKTITGVHEPTAGEIHLRGAHTPKYSTRQAQEAGVACAYQDLSLCTNLTVYENFALLSMAHTLFEKPGWRRKKQQETRALLEKYFPDNGIDVMKPVSALSLAEQQIVEICKTLMTENLKVLILDEPTSALSTDKAKQLHAVVKQFSAQGVAVIYISHKLDEIRTVSDRIVMMRNGQPAGECDPASISEEELVGMMGGEAKANHREAEQAVPQAGEVLVRVENLSQDGLRNVSVVVRKGEILGISGLVGSGQTQLLQAIFDKASGRRQKNVTVNASVSYVSGDRAREGVFPLWNIQDNILISSLDQVKRGPLLNGARARALAQHWYDKLKFKAEGVESPILSLSGGNQQKALIARGIACGAQLIILNDPTAGVDIETKQEIYALLEEAKQAGKSIILYSTEDAEIEICDRAYIMHEGAVTQELVGADITVANIVRASFREVKKSGTESSGRGNALRSLLGSRMFIPVATMLFMIVLNAALNPNVLSYNSVRMLLGSAVPLVFASLGQMFIVAAGDIDMGNGYSIGLANVIVATLLTQNVLVGIFSLALFLLSYVLMGALIHLRRLPAIVVTLGAQFIWLGVALVLCPSPGGSSPAWLSTLYKLRVWLIPSPAIICVLAAVGAWFILYRSKYGMVLRGIGNNATAVERSGWSYLRAKMTNYGLAGLMVVLAGLFFTAVCLGADANSSASFCMLSIATVILGGCEMSGGVVEPVGVVAAAIAMSLITSLLTFMKVGSNYQTAVTGIILILALVVKLVAKRRKGAAA